MMETPRGTWGEHRRERAAGQHRWAAPPPAERVTPRAPAAAWPSACGAGAGAQGVATVLVRILGSAAVPLPPSVFHSVLCSRSASLRPLPTPLPVGKAPAGHHRGQAAAGVATAAAAAAVAAVAAAAAAAAAAAEVGQRWRWDSAAAVAARGRKDARGRPGARAHARLCLSPASHRSLRCRGKGNTKIDRMHRASTCTAHVTNTKVLEQTATHRCRESPAAGPRAGRPGPCSPHAKSAGVPHRLAA